MGRSLSTQEAILRFIGHNGSATGPELAGNLGITRQAVSPHLRGLIAAGKIFKTGSTRAARYFPAAAAPAAQRIRRTLPIDKLDESEVYEELSIRLNLSSLPSNIADITHSLCANVGETPF